MDGIRWNKLKLLHNVTFKRESLNFNLKFTTFQESVIQYHPREFSEVFQNFPFFSLS
jgi:hypothetical protein